MLFHLHVRAYSTLPGVLSAVSHFHCRSYYTSPTLCKSVSRSLLGAKKLFGSPSVPRKIITKEILDALFDLTTVPNVSFVLLRTVWRVFMQFYGLLRYSEVSNLTISDISWTDVGFDIFISRSKTDQTGKGNWVSVAAQPGCARCPVSFTKRYISFLSYQSGFLMPSCSNDIPNGSVSLLYNSALRDLRSALRLIGIDPQGYGEHSGRRGGTTAAADKGATLDELMIQGRWRTESMPRLYTDNAIKCKRNFARRLASL